MAVSANIIRFYGSFPDALEATLSHLDTSPTFFPLSGEVSAPLTATLGHLDASPTFFALSGEVDQTLFATLSHLDASPTFFPLSGEVQLLLDAVPGAALAIAPWQLSNSYAGYARRIIAVGGPNDSLEQDFTFAELTDGTVEAWLGGGTGEVTIEYDQSGNSVDLTPHLPITRPLHGLDSGLPFLDFNGAQCLTNASLDLSGETACTVVIAAKLRDQSSTEVLLEHGTSAASAGWGVFANNGGANLIGTGHSPSTFANTRTLGDGSPTQNLVFSRVFKAGESNGIMRINGADSGVRNTSGAANFGAGNMADRAIFLGARNGTSLDAEMDFYAMLIYPGELTANQLRSLEVPLASETLAVLSPESFANTVSVVGNIDESAALIDKTDYYETSTAARLPIDTDSELIEIELYRNLQDSFDAGGELGVHVDGVFYCPVWAGDLNETTFPVKRVVHLPPGSKRVHVCNGMTSRPASESLGVWLKNVSSADTLTVPDISPENRTVFYGDSITSLWKASDGGVLIRDGYVSRFRDRVYPDSVAVESYGFRQLKHDCDGGAAVTAFVDTLETYSPQTIVLAIGTNDYGGTAGGAWSAADFGTAYAALLDEINAEMPSADVLCVSPILRSPETANSYGDTLQDYRDEIATACSTRAWATHLDGSSLLLVGDLSDGLHPDAVGMGKMDTGIASALGL